MLTSREGCPLVGLGTNLSVKSALMGCDLRAPIDLPSRSLLELAKNEVLALPRPRRSGFKLSPKVGGQGGLSLSVVTMVVCKGGRCGFFPPSKYFLPTQAKNFPSLFISVCSMAWPDQRM